MLVRCQDNGTPGLDWQGVRVLCSAGSTPSGCPVPAAAHSQPHNCFDEEVAFGAASDPGHPGECSEHQAGERLLTPHLETRQHPGRAESPPPPRAQEGSQRSCPHRPADEGTCAFQATCSGSEAQGVPFRVPVVKGCHRTPLNYFSCRSYKLGVLLELL